MADSFACLTHGKVVLIQEGHEPAELESPYAEQVGARERAMASKARSRTRARGAALTGAGRAAGRGGSTQQAPTPARVVGVTRGRVNGELCYAISTGVASGIFGQKPGTREEQRLFHSADAVLGDLDYSFAEEAFTCTVDGKGGTSAIGVLADDGKGVRTVTEGDVLDRGPRWVPGGVGQIVYASAGIGRTQSGAWAGRSPFSLHRLRMNDSTVEVLVSDAKYDYVAPIAVSDSVLYAIRRAYQETKPKASVFSAISELLLTPFRLGNAAQTAADAERMLLWGDLVEVSRDVAHGAHDEGSAARGYELVRVTPKASEVVAEGVVAFDVAPNGDIVYSNGRALYRATAAKGAHEKLLANLRSVEQIVIC